MREVESLPVPLQGQGLLAPLTTPPDGRVMSALEITVLGRPAPQGSHKFVGMRGGRPIIVDNSKTVGPWRATVKAAALMAMRITGGVYPITAPVRVDVELFIHHAPSNRDPLPSNKNTGDTDKHLRSIFDALVQAGAIDDDSLVVITTARKQWATTRQPGATIRITPIPLEK